MSTALDTPAAPTVTATRRWSMLAASTLAQAGAAVTTNGMAFLIPTLHRDGLSLAAAGTVVAAPTVGVMLSLVAWGWVTDRRGERNSLLAGLAVTAAACLVGVVVGGHSHVALAVVLLIAGAAAASTNAASGRVVVGWFPPQRRGLAMGIRQMAQPVGVGVAAVLVGVVASHAGVGTAMWVPGGAALVGLALVGVLVIDPPRPARSEGTAANPYRGDRYLARVHGVSMLLVVPQFAVWTFALVWLEQSRGWSPVAAGTLVALAQVAGAFGRIAAGQLSDVVGSRMRPLRWVSIAAALTMALLGLTAGLDWAVAVPLVVLATVVTVADNGLAFTGVAERAGPHWSGRALGAQNTAQFLAGALVPPLGGWAITHSSYAAVFGLAALFPVVAIGFVPVAGERRLE